VKRLSAFVLPALLALTLGAVALAPAASAVADPFAEGCPKETLEEGASVKLNHNPAAKHAFVPAGATSLRICRYWGFGNESGKQTPKTQARAGTLNDQAEVHSKALLEGLTYEFRELEAAPKGPISCPFDDGTELYAVFFYRHAEPVIVHVALSGCRFAYAAAPRAREMTESLEKKLVRIAKGERVKSKPKRGEVTEKSRVANTPAAFGCRYKAKLLTGEVCTGTMSVKDYGGSISNSPGVQSSSEGECFYLFAPPHFKEEMEEEEREEAEEKEGGKHSSRAT
jgi:hypothetical protein